MRAGARERAAAAQAAYGLALEIEAGVLPPWKGAPMRDLAGHRPERRIGGVADPESQVRGPKG